MPTIFAFIAPPKGSSKPVASYSDLVGVTNGPNGKLLKTEISLSAFSIAAAALEVGYGPKDKWHTNAPMTPAERKELARFLTSRARTMLRMFEVSNGQLIVRKFNRLLDGSDKTAMHYALGQVGAAFAIEEWLGHKPLRIIHAGPLAASMVRADDDCKMLPDFLVEDESKEWHALEAKGGGAPYKSEAISKGLQQLYSIDGFWQSPLAQPHLVNQRVCSFLQIPDPGSPIAFTVADPPGDGSADERKTPLLLVDFAEAEQYLMVSEVLRSLRPIALAPGVRHPDTGTWRNVGFAGIHVLVAHVSPALKELRWKVDLMHAAIRTQGKVETLSLTTLRSKGGPLPPARATLVNEVLAAGGLTKSGQAAQFLEEFDVVLEAGPQGTRRREHVICEMERRLNFPEVLQKLRIEFNYLWLQLPSSPTYVTRHGVYTSSADEEPAPARD